VLTHEPPATSTDAGCARRYKNTPGIRTFESGKPTRGGRQATSFRGRPSKAIESLEGALKLDSANTALKPLLEKARAELAKANRITALIETARRQMSARRTTVGRALSAQLPECLEEAPGQRFRLPLCLSSFAERIERRDREQRMEADAHRSKDLAVARFL
jgi:hypothetical protein